MIKIAYLFLFLFCNNILVSAQSINAVIASKTGNFNTCGTVSTVTATYVSGTGSAVINGTLTCLDPAGSTIIDLVLNNISWDQGPTMNWIHGLFFPANGGVGINSTTLVAPPMGWVFMSGGCTGGCPSGLVGGPDFYFSGPGASCCPGGGNNNSLRQLW